MELKIIQFIATNSNGRTQAELHRRFNGKSPALLKSLQRLRAARLLRFVDGTTPIGHWVLTDMGKALAP